MVEVKKEEGKEDSVKQSSELSDNIILIQSTQVYMSQKNKMLNLYVKY